MTRQNAFEILRERGFVKQVTDENAVQKVFEKKQVTVYVGFDPTADSLHVGNLIGLMALAHVQRAGHIPIAILGDGTTMIGDPSGRTELRKMLTFEQISANAEKIKTQINRYFTIDSKNGFMVRNSDWLLQLKHVDFLREIGRHFSVNRMLAAEAYKIRMETGLSFIEFNYQILQAFDFLKLYESHKCTVQMGGDDQWGNIIAGCDLIRRIKGVAVEGITWPLLTTAGGQKMGKTASGALWLDADKTSPYEYYQYWINCDDRDVGKLLACFTFLPMPEVEALSRLEGAEIRKAKEILAFETTRITHGEAEASKAQETSRSAFGNGGENIDSMPTSEFPFTKLQDGIYASDLFARVGLTSSKGEARRLIKQGGAYVNQRKIEDIEARLTVEDVENSSLILRAGKKRYHRVILT